MVRHLVDLNEDIYAEISNTALVANQREYILPTDDSSGTGSNPYGGGLIKLSRVEVSYDNATWQVCRSLSLDEIPTPTILDSDLNLQYTQRQPVVWFKDRSLFLAPVPAAADAGTVANNTNLYIYWIKRPKELVNTTDIPNIPKDFLGVLAEGILIDVFRKYGRINDSRIAQQNFNAGLATMRSFEQGPNINEPVYFKMARKRYM